MGALPKGKPGDVPHYDYNGWIRRNDLILRTRYPNLETRIFEVQPNQYVIVFDRAVLDAVAVRDEFARSIRFITLNAGVANDVPEKYVREIAPLRDDEIARGYAGIPFSVPDINNLIAARFPKLPIVAVRDGGDPMMVTVELSENISKADEELLLAFCNGLEAIVPWQVAIVPRPDTPPADEASMRIAGLKMPMPDADPLAVRATRRRG